MELCTGGNLYEVIDAPENAYGLSEHEFLRVVIDVGNVELFTSTIVIVVIHVYLCYSQWDEIFAQQEHCASWRQARKYHAFS